ncbi:hypothetical protein GQ473_04270 [archaeon]|nr:hypothetical protein [archaeon]
MTQKFNINTLIQKGKELVFEYELPAGTVYYRPLTDLEMDESESLLLTTITDQATCDYIMNLGDNKKGDKEEEDKEEDNKDSIDIVNIDFTQIVQGNAAVACSIVLTAIQDFSDEKITIDDISKLSGIKELADEIKRVSGYDMDVIAEVEEFREDE